MYQVHCTYGKYINILCIYDVKHQIKPIYENNMCK